MSGGSFNYLCDCDPDTILGRLDDIRAMERAFRELGWAEDAADATKKVIDLVLAALAIIGPDSLQ